MRGKDLTEHTATRRELMRLLGIAGGAAAAVGMGGTLDGFGAHVLAQTPATNGERPEIVIGVQGVPANLDPGQDGGSVINIRIANSIFDWLIDCDYLESDPPGMGTTLIPSLATAWTRIDELTLELTLRDDVLFHNGDPMTADDVKYTVDRIIDPNGDPLLKAGLGFYASIDHVEVVDDHTVRIVTIAPNPVLETSFTNPTFMIVPRKHVEAVGIATFGQKPVAGSGAYKLVEIVENDRVVLEAFDQYWGSPAAFSKVTFKMIPEVATRIVAVSSDQAQMITTVPPDQLAQFEGNADFLVQTIPAANCHIYHYNTKHPNVADKRIRQALNLGFDRQLLVDTLWLGYAQVMGTFQIERWGDMFNPDRTPIGYDPEKAKTLLAEANYSGAEIVFRAHPSYYMLGAEAAQAIVAMWQDLGVNARVEITETPSADQATLMIKSWSNTLAPHDPAATFWNWWGPNGSPQKKELWTPPAGYNDLGTILTSTTDHQERFDAFQKILDIWEDEAPAAILYNQKETYVSQADTRVIPHTVYGLDLRESNIAQ